MLKQRVISLNIKFLSWWLGAGDIRVRYVTQGFEDNTVDCVWVDLGYFLKCYYTNSPLYAGKGFVVGVKKYD